MSTDERRPERRTEIDAILERKPGVHEVRDEADRYTVVGAASRRTYANWLTPIGEHFVCHRNPIPDADADSWTVTLTGLPNGDAELSIATLEADFPTVAVANTMECAGNGRGQHDPETGSVQWDCEAVGTAVWSGTPLSSVLRAHGVEFGGDGDDRWLTAVGGDSLDEEAFARSIPLSKAFDDCILATGMNGQPLPEEHGYPIRLIVPGWYGVNNVKWVDALHVVDSMVTEGALDRSGTHARWQQVDYRIHPPDATPTEHDSVETVDTRDQLESDAVDYPYTFTETVMSLIGEPSGDSPITPRSDGTVEITGVAWAGDDAVAGVDVSTDGGDTWVEAELFGPAYAGAWRLFRYSWDADPGSHVLCSRATDERGRSQPARIAEPDAGLNVVEDGAFPWNEGGYAANAYEPNAVEVTVEAKGK